MVEAEPMPQESSLDAVFGALADPTRRAMLRRLTEGPANITELGAPFRISQPAISKHMKVLDRAGLVERTKQGREFRIRLNPQPMDQATSWMAQMKRFWEGSLDGLSEYLENETTDKKGKKS